MKLHIEEISPVVRRITVELSAGKVDAFLDAAVRHYSGTIAQDGLQAGNVSPAVEEKHFAEEIIARARQNILDSVIASVIREHKLCLVNRAACGECLLMRGQACSFTLHVEVVPHLPLPEKLADLSVRVRAAYVEPAHFFTVLQHLRHARGTLREVTAPRCPEDGDVVCIDVQAQCAGKPVHGLCAQNITLRLGKDEEHPELCCTARTLKVGEQGSCMMLCPPHYPDPTVRDKRIQLTVRLHAIKKADLPYLDDSFAAGLGYENLRCMQEEMYKDLLNTVIVRNQREAEENLLDSLLAPLHFSVPPTLFTIHNKSGFLQAKSLFERQGFTGRDLEEKLAAIAPEVERSALRQARTQAFLMFLAYRENIVVSEQDLEEEIQKMARQCHRDAIDMKQDIYISNAVYELQDQILADKALRLLYTKAQKILVDKDGNPVPT